MKRIVTHFTSVFLLFILPGIVLAQVRQGRVQSATTGAPLSNVTIQAVNGAAKALSAEDGTFSIDAGTATLFSFSYVGYESKEINIDSIKGDILVLLTPSGNNLDEVVVTALGISRQKKSLGYATQELKYEDIAQAKETNLVNSLAGKVAGVRVTNSQGDIGSSRIVIRGETSISGNNQPLFIVDGIPVDNSQLGAGNSRDFRNAIADINAEDIENISVLKGPNAAALYGSRAAHGVIIITTKSGKGQKGIGVTLNSNTTFSNIQLLPDYQNVFGQGADGKFSYVDGRGAGINDGVDESWGPRMDGQLIPQFFSNGEPVPFVAHPNNVRDYFNTGVTYSNGISIAGSNEKSDFRVSYNNEKQYGVIPNSEVGKNNVSFNTSYNITSKLKISLTGSYIRDFSPNVPGSGGKRSTSPMLQFAWFGRQVDVNKLRDLYNENPTNPINWNNSYYSNMFFIANKNTVQQTRDRFIGTANLNYKIADGLAFNFRTGSDFYNDKRKLKIAYFTNGTPYGSYEEDNYNVNENNTEATLRYNKNLNDDFSIDVLAGGNLRTKEYEQNNQKAPRLAVADVYTLTNSRDPLISSNYYSKLKTYSAFASAQVGFRNYAFLNLTARNDWSSTLPAQNLSYFYPSVNASLILTDAFDIKSAVLNFAKLRGGWSKVGSDADPYQLINTYNFNAPFNGYPQLTSSGIDLNANLKSESTNSTELGFEMGLFSNRLRLDLSLYNTNSIDQILKVDVTASTGYTQKLLNAGKINNKGIEVQLGITPVKTNAFQWDVDVNFAANKSRVKILDYEKRLQNYVLGSSGTVQVIAAVGKAYGTLYGNAYLRDSAGNIVVNSNGLPIADPSKKVLGKYTPDWIGGITNSFSYKNINLSFLVDASIGGSLFSGTNATGTYTGVLASTLPGRDAAHGGLAYYYPGDDNSNPAVPGTPANGETAYDDGIIAKGVTTDGKQNQTIVPASQYYKAQYDIDEQFVYSASYVKLREVRLGYTLPGAWVKKLGLVSASVALVGRNLWIIHKDVPNIDPETAFNTGNAQGLEDLTLPTARSFGFNINVKF